MSDNISSSQLAALREKAVRARKMLGDACSRGHFKMSIPPQHEHDEDLVIADVLNAVPELLDRLEALEKEVAREPDHCWDHDDPENGGYPWEDRADLADDLPVGDYMRVDTGFKGPDKWLARVPTQLDEDGCAEDDELLWFDSEEEAKAAIDAARQAGPEEGQ